MWYKFSQPKQPSLFLEPWHEGSIIKDDNNQPKRLYHGTLTPDFEAFDLDKANKDSYLGPAIYTSDNPDDVNNNYSNINSGDWTSKINSLADQYESNEEDEEDETYYDKQKDFAKKELGINDPRPSTIPLYGKMKNPEILSPAAPRTFGLFDYNEELDDYVEGNGQEIVNTIIDMLYDYGYGGENDNYQISEVQDAENVISESLMDGEFNLFDVEQTLNKIPLYDYDINKGEFLQDLIKRLGHDGVIMDAEKYFPKIINKPTNHYVFFDPKQLKSPNSGTFDPRSESLMASTKSWYKFSQQILPPVHDRCHCYIETMPAGNKIWQFSDRCCEQCKALGKAFNDHQNTILNAPAQINPPIEDTPAIIPEEVGENPQIPELTTENFRYTPRYYFKTKF